MLLYNVMYSNRIKLKSIQIISKIYMREKSKNIRKNTRAIFRISEVKYNELEAKIEHYILP